MNDIKLMIIGAQKAGTTSLNKYLAQHPDIYTHFTIEFSMLATPENFDKGLEYNINQSVEKSILGNNEKQYFIAKRVELMYDAALMRKFYESFPDCKIIVVLRNPVDRAFSAFKYCRKNGMEPYKKFDDAIFINDESRFKNSRFKRNCNYVSRSSYLKHLNNVFSVFPKENIRIYLFEEIVKDLRKPLNEMVSMLNLPAYDFNTDVNYNEGASSKSESLSKLIAPGKFGALKKLLSLEQRTKIKLFVKKLNAGKNTKEENVLSENTRRHLVALFKDEVIELENFLNLPLNKYWPEFFTA